ncbi:acyloxyacyl hydrolase [Pseudomonas monteilii]|uniref:acyloxyacyl hydrolase n=1 Tax=Pseudomonas monteilii TaxID=76759 RepID=UPI002363CC67|nr:acyloxyacyl hydrolase [Pseudomonas monteilii]EKT9494753.1 acyloxyacyl hydrolase [Pseudomonas aeruginosa]MDD2127489.1 acyloxyacyl hydrolase [Pseudomonas monteilii]
MNLRIATLSAALLALPLFASADDRLTAAVGVTGQDDMTVRLGFEWDWIASWWDSATGHLSGHWDGAYTYWEGGDEASGAHSLSFSPVLVYSFEGWRHTPYIEAGIGVAFFSKTDVGEQRLGSSFNFEDRIGFGLQLPNAQRVGLRFMHYSNAGLKQPNDGIESYSLYYSLPL